MTEILVCLNGEPVSGWLVKKRSISLKMRNNCFSYCTDIKRYFIVETLSESVQIAP